MTRSSLVSLVCLALLLGASSASKVLYGTQYAPTVSEYDGKAKTGLFDQSSKARVVEFYSPSCGACQHFKPEYLKLAKEITAQYKDVEFYAISCEHNYPVCLKYKVGSYPSLIAFQANSNEKITLQRSKLAGLGTQSYSSKDIVKQLKLKAKTEQEMRRLDKDVGKDIQPQEKTLIKTTFAPKIPSSRHRVRADGRPGMEGQKFIPGAGAAKARDKRDALKMEKFGAKGQMKKADVDRYRAEMKERREKFLKERKTGGGLSKLYNGEPKYGIGKTKVKHEDKIIEMKKHRTMPGNMTVGMKKFKPGTEEYETRKKELWAKMEAARKNRKHSLFRRASTTKPSEPIRKSNFPLRKNISKPGIVKRTAERIPVVRRVVKMSQEEALILDASMAFIQSLRYGVYKSLDPLKPAETDVLKSWLELLSVSLPPEWALHRLIDTLREKIKVISVNERHLAKVLDSYKLPRVSYSPICRRAGLSCGFWKLLHTATVGVAEQRGGLNLIEAEMVSESTRVFSPIEAADTIRDYMASFFNCKTCSEHFVKTYDDCSNNRRCDRLTDAEDDAETADWKELPLWMWEFHNDVSVRVLKENIETVKKHVKTPAASSKKDELEAIWPDLNNCLLCFEDDGTWDEPEVFNMLERAYWPEATVDPAMDRLLVATYDDETNTILGSLWITMLVILVIVYKAVGSKSAAIQKSVLLARTLVANTTGIKNSGRSKERSA